MSAGKVRQGGVFVEIGADAKKFFATLSQVNAQIGKAGKAMAMMGAKLTAVGTAITAPIAGAAAAFAMVGDAAQKMAARTGMSVEAVTGLAFAAEQSGTDMATLEKGIRNMQRTLDDAATKGGAAADALKRLGIDASRLAGMSPEDQFTMMAQALSQIQDPGERAALAMKVFGRAGTSLIPLLNGGAAGIAKLRAEAERLGIVMDKDTADSAAALTDAMNAMNRAFRAIVVNVGGAVAPIFTQVAQVVSMAAGDFSRFVKENGRFVQIALAVGGGVAALGAALTAAGFAVMGMSAALSALASPFLLIGRLAAGLISVAASVVTSLFAMSASIAAATTQAALALSRFVVTAVGQLASYAASAAMAAAASLVSAAKVAAAWAGQALVGVMSFVGSALSGIASYLGGVALAVASTVASTAAMAAAWLAPMAPLIAIGAAVGALLMNLGKVGPMMSGAFGSIGGTVGNVANTIAGPLRVAVQDAAIVLEDLGATAGKTFQGISDAISAGNLAGAMDMLWAGLLAGWLRGTEALMSYVDPWVAFLQNTFTYLGTEIAVTWESMWSGMTQGFNTAKAVIMGIMDNLINGVMAAFDRMVAAVRKSWNWVQSFIVRGYDLEKENNKVDSEMTARAAQRQAQRPGMEGRMAGATLMNASVASNAQRNIDAMRSNADATAAGRYDRNAQLADERRAATLAAEARVDELAAKLATEAATAIEEREKKTASALDLGGLADAAGAGSDGSKADVVGTFSAFAASGLGVGQNLQQKIAEATSRTANAVERMALEGALAAQD
jgi:hypothetical protein